MSETNHGTNSSESDSPYCGSDRPVWPQQLRPIMLMGSVGMAAVAALGITTAAEGWRSGDTLSATGYGGGSLMMALLSVVMLREAGFRYIGLSRKIRPLQDPVHGSGVAIPTSRMLFPVLIAALIATAGYGVASSVGWFSGIDESLLPDGRNSRAGAIYMAVLAVSAVALALFLASIRIDTVLSIYSDGVERYSLRRILLSNKKSRIFVGWQDITHIHGGTTDSLQHPGIDIHTDSALSENRRTPHDGEHKIAFMAHVLVAEPNTLFALLKRLHENPDERKLLSEPNATELLRPPPLLERFRSARGQKAKV